MMNRSIILVFSVLFFAGILTPAFAQSFESVVINEVDINPHGDDSASISEWVELYNPTSSDIYIGEWEIASTTVLKKTMNIPYGTIIQPGQFLTYSYDIIWFTDTNESVELRDGNGVVVDKTPAITDTKDDFTSWQRLYDGYDFDSSDDWKFVTSTTGSSNGMLVEIQDSKSVVISVSSEKPSYLFGDVAVITGSVSEEVYMVKPFFQPEQIVMTITGPNFDKIITMYPDLNLEYSTTLSLHQVLGIDEGTYDVSVSYAGIIENTTFSVGYEIIEQEIKQDEELSITTNESQYIPGQNVAIVGFASEIIPFEGMKFTVTDSAGTLISNGNLYPTNGEFKTSIYLTTVDSQYGTYYIIAEYSDKSTATSFEVVEDFKEDVPISLWVDKEAYGLGEKVSISGRVNQAFVSTLDLEIIQTKQTSISSSGSNAGFKILDGVTLQGDSSFKYSFIIPEHENRLGAYKISVSKDIGSATIIIPVVEDPENFIASNEPLTVQTDKDVYDFNESMNIQGFVEDPYSNSSYGTGSIVSISISHEDGSQLEILTQGKNKKISEGVVTGYTFSAIPETSGLYSIDVDITQNIFTAGNYIVKSQYGSFTATDTFSVVDSLDLEDGAEINIDKEIYGLGETVHMTGILPPTGDNSVSISVTRPDGTTAETGALVENQRFSWDWNVPVYEKPQKLKDDEGRDVRLSNYGIYKIRVAISSESTDIFFKVSADPENDMLSTSPLFVSTEKSLYKAGERLKVSGNVIKLEQGDEGLIVTERIQIRIIDAIYRTKIIHESNVYPNQGGEFTSLFELPATIFTEGEYIVRANYLQTQTESRFSVANDFSFGGDVDLSLLLNTDRSEYYPGDAVEISGKPSKLIYIEKFEVSILQQIDHEIDCGSFYCGTNTGPVTTIRPSPSASFTHQYVIPDVPTAIGSYKVTVDADFETKSIIFNVIEKPSTPTPDIVIEKPSTPKLDTVIEKVNRISEKVITIFTEEKTTDDITIAPRVISGSLVTPIRGDESDVNLKVSTVTGTCIIGLDADCLVRESTRKPGQIYDVVEVDGISLNVRYSGPDVRLEKFSILPESSIEFLPDVNWNVKVIKDEQVSRFYYKVTYKTLE